MLAGLVPGSPNMMEGLLPGGLGLPNLGLRALVDILLVAFLIYQTIMLLRGRRAAHIAAGIGVVIIAYAISVWMGLELLRSILSSVVPYVGFILIVLFQSDIRRALARIGRSRWPAFSARVARDHYTDILMALSQFSQTRTGALIVIERDIGLRTFTESGVRLDAKLSRDLLISIFHRNSPLHDGAAIVQGDRIVAAACFLPLSMNPNISRKLGTRHRAAIGVTEETDCLAIVVSEQTGRISIAYLGEIEQDVDLHLVEDKLETARRHNRSGRISGKRGSFAESAASTTPEGPPA